MEHERLVSWDEFRKCIKQMKNLSDDLYDEWMMQGNIDAENDVFLIKRTKLQRTFNNQQTFLTIEYHVVYDHSYCVPKLCFNVFKNDGALLQLEECAKIFNFTDLSSVLGIFTQMEHPVLHRPIYTLHPCKTSQLLEVISGPSKNIIVTWLSTVGPTVGLLLMNEYSQLT